MILIIGAVLLMLGITFFQTIKGTFSSLIMFIATVLSLAVAFNYYEPLAQSLYAVQPGTADAISLIAVFFVTLLVLRILADMFIKGNVTFSPWVDRIFGGLLGLSSASMMVGVLLIAMQMLPWGGASVIGYQPYNDALKQQGSAFFDFYAAGQAKTLSAGALAGDRPYGEAHDNLILELQCARNTCGLGGRIDAPPKAMEIAVRSSDRTSWMTPELRNITGEPVILRTMVSEMARNANDKWWRLPATHFRLVTDKGQSLYPIGFLTYNVAKPRDHEAPSHSDYRDRLTGGGWKLIYEKADTPDGRLAFATGKSIVCRPWFPNGGPRQLAIDWVWVLPPGHRPAYVVFRRTTRVAVPAEAVSSMPSPAEALARIEKNF